MSLTSQIRYIRALDSTATDGSGKTALAFGDITAAYLVESGTLTALTTEDITTLGTYQSPTDAAHIRIKELAGSDPTKGVYEIHFHDTQVAASGVKLWLFLSASGAAFQPLEMDLQNSFVDGVLLAASQTNQITFGNSVFFNATSNNSAIVIQGSGNASGINIQGGGSGGEGMLIAAQAGNSAGILVNGFGSGSGIEAYSASTGHGLFLLGGATSGDAIALSNNGGTGRTTIPATDGSFAALATAAGLAATSAATQAAIGASFTGTTSALNSTSNGILAAINASSAAGLTALAATNAGMQLAIHASYAGQITALAATSAGIITHGDANWEGGGGAPTVGEIDTQLSGTHGAGLWGPTGGSGSVTVTQDLGGTDNLTVLDDNNVGVLGATIQAFLQSDWDAGNRGNIYIKDQTTTDVNGRWVDPMHLDPADYTFVAFKTGVLQTNTKNATVS